MQAIAESTGSSINSSSSRRIAKLCFTSAHVLLILPMAILLIEHQANVEHLRLMLGNFGPRTLRSGIRHPPGSYDNMRPRLQGCKTFVRFKRKITAAGAEPSNGLKMIARGNGKVLFPIRKPEFATEQRAGDQHV